MSTVPKLHAILRYLGAGDLLAGFGRAVFRRGIGIAVPAVIGAALVVIAAGYGAWGGYLTIAASIGPARAALVISVALLVVAVVFLLVAWRFANGHLWRRPSPSPAQGLPFQAEDVELVLKLLKDRVEDDPLATSLLSLLGGFVAGAMLFNRR